MAFVLQRPAKRASSLFKDTGDCGTVGPECRAHMPSIASLVGTGRQSVPSGGTEGDMGTLPTSKALSLSFLEFFKTSKFIFLQRLYSFSFKLVFISVKIPSRLQIPVFVCL